MVIKNVYLGQCMVTESLSLGSLIKVIGFVFFNVRASTLFIPSHVFSIVVKLSLTNLEKIT